MKILIASDWFLKLVIDGQAASLRRRGHEVTLLCRDHALEFGGASDERDAVLSGLVDAGVRVIQLPGRRFGSDGLRAMAVIKRTLRRWRPDVANVHENDDPRLLALTLGFPLVYTVHDPVPHPGADWHPVERFVKTLWLRRANRVVIHARQLEAELPASVQRDRVRVVPHGIDVPSR